MGKFYCEGDASKGYCSRCKSVVRTTFKLTTLPLSSKRGSVDGVLAALCDICGEVVSIPQQSTPRIREILLDKKCSVEARIPRHLRDVLLSVCSEVASDTKATEIEPFVIRYYIAHIAHNKIKLDQLKKHLKSRLTEGKANDRISFRMSDQVFRKFEEKLKAFKMSKTEALKAIILQAKTDLIDKGAPRRLREISMSASAA